MIKLHDEIFFGIYSYLLKAEGGEKKEVSRYFAYSSLMALVFLELIVLAILLLFSGGLILQENIKLIAGICVTFSLFLINWIAFFKKDRYRVILSDFFKKDKSRRRLAERKAFIVVGVVFVSFVTAVVIKVMQFS